MCIPASSELINGFKMSKVFVDCILKTVKRGEEGGREGGRREGRRERGREREKERERERESFIILLHCKTHLQFNMCT